MMKIPITTSAKRKNPSVHSLILPQFYSRVFPYLQTRKISSNFVSNSISPSVFGCPVGNILLIIIAKLTANFISSLHSMLQTSMKNFKSPRNKTPTTTKCNQPMKRPVKSFYQFENFQELKQLPWILYHQIQDQMQTKTCWFSSLLPFLFIRLLFTLTERKFWSFSVKYFQRSDRKNLWT